MESEKLMTITVIFRDDSPMIYAGDTPKYRTVVINLTENQIAKLNTRNKEEHVSMAILQEVSADDQK